MKRSELVLSIAKKTNYDAVIVDNILKSITDEISCSLRKSESVSIHGFGKFVASSY